MMNKPSSGGGGGQVCLKEGSCLQISTKYKQSMKQQCCPLRTDCSFCLFRHEKSIMAGVFLPPFLSFSSITCVYFIIIISNHRSLTLTLC